MNDNAGESRSRIMRAVKSRGNKTTEKRLRASLISRGISGWHLHDKSLPGTPDFVFRNSNIAIFVDGCFWHGCPECYRRPSTSKKYWDKKLETNIERDKRVTQELEALGWTVIRIWEHSLVRPSDVIYQIVDVL